MKRLRIPLIAATVFSAVCLTSAAADAGCYRMGETGYHWYRYCFGPGFLYPHRRVCRFHRHCWYR